MGKLIQVSDEVWEKLYNVKMELAKNNEPYTYDDAIKHLLGRKTKK